MNTKMMSRDGVTNREQAIKHVISSTKYWSSNHGNEGFYPHNESTTSAFKMAVRHVNVYHYILSLRDIREAKRRMGLK